MYILTAFALKSSNRRVRLDVAKYSFNNRSANELNILGEGIIEASLLTGFKRKLYSHLKT